MTEVVEHALHRQLPPRDAALAQAADAGVRLDLDDELVAEANPHGEALDGRDLHICSFLKQFAVRHRRWSSLGRPASSAAWAWPRVGTRLAGRAARSSGHQAVALTP